MKYWVLLLCMPAVLGCVVPRDGMSIGKSLQLCTDVYYLNHGLSISGKDITLDCNGAVLKSWSKGKGISVEDSSNITVSGCRIVHYSYGFYVKNSTRIFLNDNHLVRNLVGTRFVSVSDSATFNHDVSLGAPFEVHESAHNVISLTNKPVTGDFCGENFCNAQRNTITSFVQPETTMPQMHSWLIDQLTGRKTTKRLKNWIFGGFFSTAPAVQQ